MKRMLVVAATCLSVGLPAYAFAQSETGGPSGGPNQAQAPVPSGTTGGASGGPNQAQSVTTKKHHHHHHHHHHHKK